MILSEKEKDIIHFVGNQEFCFLSDIRKKFFRSDSACSQKISKLRNNDFLSMIRVNQTKLKSLFSQIPSNRKIIYLNKKGLRKIHKKRRPSFYKATHQVLLFQVKEKLERLLEQKGLYENELKNLKGTIYESFEEPYPDFVIKGDSYKLAVELELNLKSLDRYEKKIASYLRSSYTHILYIVLKKKMKDSLLQVFEYQDSFAVTYYNYLKQPYSRYHGNFNLKEWVNGQL